MTDVHRFGDILLSSSLLWATAWAAALLANAAGPDFAVVLAFVASGFGPPLVCLILYRLAHLERWHPTRLGSLLSDYLAWALLWTAALMSFEYARGGMTATFRFIPATSVIFFAPPLVCWLGYRAIKAAMRARETAARRSASEP